MAHLNVNGWTLNNEKLRKELLSNINVDIISINETHLRLNDQIMLKTIHGLVSIENILMLMLVNVLVELDFSCINVYMIYLILM